jgi:hypothetical protein
MTHLAKEKQKLVARIRRIRGQGPVELPYWVQLKRVATQVP